jgi:hypothetical protein
MKTCRGFLFVALLVCWSILSSQALTAPQRSAIRTALESAKTVELPRIAETLMCEAKDSDRAETAKMILDYVITKRVAAARAVFAGMSKLYPQTFVAVAPTTDFMSRSEALAAQPPLLIGIRQPPQPSDLRPIARPPLPVPQAGDVIRVGPPNRNIGAVNPGGVPRGAANTVPTAPVTQSNIPINTTSGGNGSGTFSGIVAIPAGSNPCTCPYEQPRY